MQMFSVYWELTGLGVAVSAYPPFRIGLPGGEGGMLKQASAYRGYVETSFNIPTGTLKLEKDQFQVTPPP